MYQGRASCEEGPPRRARRREAEGERREVGSRAERHGPALLIPVLAPAGEAGDSLDTRASLRVDWLLHPPRAQDGPAGPAWCSWVPEVPESVFGILPGWVMVVWPS